jgi:hypothetical protein
MSEKEQRRLIKAIIATNEIQNRVQAILMKLASEEDDGAKVALIQEYRANVSGASEGRGAILQRSG